MTHKHSIFRGVKWPALRPHAGIVFFILILALMITIMIGGWNLFFERLSIFSTVFLSVFIEAAPFLLLGSLASAVVEVFFTHEDFSRWMPSSALGGALTGALMGFFFPVCECGVVPFTRRLFQKGLPLPVGISFLLGAPALNPVVLASTYIAFGWGPVLWGRVAMTLLVAVLAGVVFGLQGSDAIVFNRQTLDFLEGDTPICARPAPSEGRLERMQRIFAVTADEFFDTGRFLVAGAALASLMQTVLPQPLLLSAGQGAVLSVLVMTALAFLLSVCSTVDAFIALSFAGSFTTGSLLAFLTFGPMVDIKSSMMFLQLFRRRTVAYLILIPLSLVVLFSLFINLNLGW